MFLNSLEVRNLSYELFISRIKQTFNLLKNLWISNLYWFRYVLVHSNINELNKH